MLLPFSLVINLCFLIPEFIAHIFHSTSELGMLLEMLLATKEEKAETEAHPVTTEAKISTFLIKLKAVKICLYFLLLLIKSF